VRLELTRRADLATRALVLLAGSGERLKGARLAEALGTTEGFVPQVVQPLVVSGWVRSERGPTGGYSASVDLSTVSVLDVIEAVEGATPTTRCVLADRPCNETGRCALHDPWSRARTQLLGELAATPLSSLPPLPTADLPTSSAARARRATPS
jgi:Rrf2 family iron-sulfur cluster assembly transcriptional regulator